MTYRIKSDPQFQKNYKRYEDAKQKIEDSSKKKEFERKLKRLLSLADELDKSIYLLANSDKTISYSTHSSLRQELQSTIKWLELASQKQSH